MGDVAAPTIQMRGDASVTLTVGNSYSDAGATASDATDGDLTSRIITTNPVDTAVIGTYTVTYNVTDRSGNAASPVTRTVRVQTAEATGGGGGGSVGAELAALLALCMLAWRTRRAAVAAERRVR
jgi:hypothetical protein